MAEDTTQPTTLNRGRPPHASSAERRETILALNKEGLTGVAIARQIGVTPAAVSYHLKKARGCAVAETPLAKAG
jgi:predicted transcriptional regulator